ncbi:MAG: hypothetical protein K0V04_34990 [Deltaproteobacteria bacterium]|nr:hypothetical protein [Deltaproteobacteria bacterium]
MSSLENLVRNMTVAQLADAANLEVGALVELVLGGGKAPAAPAKPKKVAAAKPGRPAKAAASDGPSHNTRTQSGREALDTAILSFLKAQKEPSRALAVKAAVGGTSAQVRARLNTLIEAGRVTFTGKASGTRYRAK